MIVETEITTEEFLAELELSSKKVADYILGHPFKSRFKPEQIEKAMYLYPSYRGKSLRSSVLRLCCGAVGGDIEQILPICGGVEIFHTWTLVHDDIIDNDSKRRGGPTVHQYFQDGFTDWAKTKYDKLDKEKHAKDYGRDVAILAGDMQHGWAISMITELSNNHQIPPETVVGLVNNLEIKVLPELLEGEYLDVHFTHDPVDTVSVEQIIDMEAKKTGALYGYCGWAGATLGGASEKVAKDLEQFCCNAGIAFQFQDDILGILGDEGKLGKPVGSDIREGKRTLITHFFFQNASAPERKRMNDILGKEDASIDEIEEAKRLLIDSGSVDKVKQMAEDYIKKALPYLNDLPKTKYKNLLLAWAKYMVEREY